MQQRDFVLIAACLMVFMIIFNNVVDGKLCPSLKIRNDPKYLERLRNCTIIMGHLEIVLIHNIQDASAFENYTFPELTEIVEYLLIFKIHRINSLSALFPNLKIIRGKKLFGSSNYFLVIYQMPDLQEIGLTNLQRIGRGSVKVQHCPIVCYVNTINWKDIGASEPDVDHSVSKNCHPCPRECNGYCWNTSQCQKSQSRDCHDQCVFGCTKEKSPSHCVDCKYYNDDGTCVESCPEHKLVDNYAMRCWTRDECQSLNGTWWIFNNTCVNKCPLAYEKTTPENGGCRYVGEEYKKSCPGYSINSINVLEELEPCTHINGSLELRIEDSNLVPRLEIYLGKIVEITGNLKIGRSSAIKSLEFLKSLKKIRGQTLENQQYALYVYGNQNLQRLWNFSDNFELTIENGTMAFYNNPQLCMSEIEALANYTKFNGTINLQQIAKFSNGYNSACISKDMNITIIEINPTNVTITWKQRDLNQNETIIGYTIYYMETTTEENLTTFQNEDTCDLKTWESVLVPNNTIQLKDLKPYTRYGYYIKIYSTSLRSEQTPVHYFNTLSDDPSEPLDFTAEATSDSSILLKWYTPNLINGNLSHYNITMILEEDYLPTIRQRDYCIYPHDSRPIEEVEPTSKPWVQISASNCSCDIENELEIFDEKISKLCKNESQADHCKYIFYNTNSEMKFGTMINKRNLVETEFLSGFNYTSNVIKYDVNETNYEFKNLRHFTLYIFYMTACNKEGDRQQCSPIVKTSQRTKKKENIDVVSNLSVEIKDKNVRVKWLEPHDTNSVLVSYHVEWKRLDLEHAKPVSECITSQQYQEAGGKYHILQLPPGKYAVRVQASSLAGPGQFSASQIFEISSFDDGSYWIIIALASIFLIVFISSLFVFRYWYKKKHALDNTHLFTSVNPDYAGPIYEEDEWEIDRNDIEIIKELGQGSFGMVYQGMIKSRRYPCAIKTVTESATVPSRLEFLNEGSVMKTFNDAHHVIKLLGIVSRGQPPLVVMELMERGDLKSYLRRCREPSQNLTTNEMYRMAAEIADGMAYLSAKKFVHRDLAARNCMVAADRTVKIGDFGMARDVYETDYYRKETVGLLPVRWMAPESLADGVFTSDSDVWSYGIVLWEMATLAEQPYQGLSNEEVFHFVKNRGKLERPPECSDLLFEVMDACWLWRPNDRPTFSDIVDKLVNHVGEDFRLVAFCYSRQGREHALNAGPRIYNPPAMSAAPEDDFYSHYDASEEEVNLYMGDSNRPRRFLPLSNQRYDNSSPHQISPGSPSSTFSFNSS